MRALGWRLDLDGFVSMPNNVPARIVSKVGEQRVNANLVVGLEEHEFGLAVFERNGIIGLDFYASEGLTPPGDSVAHGNIVSRVQQGAARDHDGNRGFHARKLYDA